jgi:dolichol-phosphate mannosyltransferase
MKTYIVVPTYNERKNISELVPLLFEKVPEAHILVVDDNSPDKTAEAVIEMQKKYANLFLLKRKGKEGLGKAYIHAFKEVLKDKDVGTVVMMDADLSHNPEYLPLMLSKVNDGGVVIGSRYIKGGATVGWELWRRILSAGGNWYCRTITGMPIRDCTGGFNAMNANALRRLDLDALGLSGYAFIMGLKHAFFTTGATFIEVPITFANRKEGESKISKHIIREGIIAPWNMRLKRK